MINCVSKEKIDILDILNFVNDLIKFCESSNVSICVVMLSCLLYSEFIRSSLDVSLSEYNDIKSYLSKIIKIGGN